jgi:S1-C subfamily serine protease
MAQSPFGSFSSETDELKVRNTYSKSFDLSKIGAFGREETLVMFEKIWHHYRLTHELEPDGNFKAVRSSKTPDTLEAKAQFFAYVKTHAPDIKLVDKQMCPSCGGTGSYLDPNGNRVECSTCGGLKQLATVYNFSLKHTGELSPSVTKYLPSSGGRFAGGAQEFKAAVDKHLNEIVAAKLTGKAPKGFGVAHAGFSAPAGVGQLDLRFKNGELLKATGTTVRITLFETSSSGSLATVAHAETKVPLDAEDRCAVPFTAFFFKDLGVSKVGKSPMDDLGDYSLLLKQVKRADSIMVKVLSVTPPNAEKAIDVDKESLWKIQRPDGAAPGQIAGPSQDSPGQPSKSRSFGSGMVFTSDGHLFTNYHVIAKATNCYVVVYENGQLTRKLPATIVSKDPKSDLVILQCKEWKPAPGSPPAPPPVVSSSHCKLGSQVFVLGFPLPGTVSSNVKYTKGDVSDMAGLDDDSSKIQHTAQIQPGNSGGPMALSDGRIIGIIVSSLSEGYALRTSGALPQGVNFSIKSDYLMTLASIAGVEIPKNAIGPEPIEHVKAYTVQIMCER